MVKSIPAETFINVLPFSLFASVKANHLLYIAQI